MKLKIDMLDSADEKTGFIYITDCVIGHPLMDGDEMKMPGCMAMDVNDALEWHKGRGCTRIVCRINSPGGELVEGMAIYDVLRACGMPVRTEVIGTCASAATCVALAGDTVAMTEGSMWMVHHPVSNNAGTVEQQEKNLEFLRELRGRVFALYAAKTGKPAEQIMQDHAVAVYYTAAMAQQYGFIDEIIGTASEPPVPADPTPVEQPQMSAVDKLLGLTSRMCAALGVPALARFADKPAAQDEALQTLMCENARLQASLNAEKELRAQMEADYAARVAAVEAREKAVPESIEAGVIARMAELGVEAGGLPAPAPTKGKGVSPAQAVAGWLRK